MTEPRSNEQTRADLDVALWKGHASSSYDALPAIRRLAEDVPNLLRERDAERARADKAEAERDDAYARGFEQVRRRCEAAEAALAAKRANVAAVEALRVPTSFNNEADDYGLGWADGAIATVKAYRAALVGGSTEGDSDR